MGKLAARYMEQRYKKLADDAKLYSYYIERGFDIGRLETLSEAEKAFYRASMEYHEERREHERSGKQYANEI